MPLSLGTLVHVLDKDKYAFSFLFLFPYCKYKILYIIFAYSIPHFIVLCCKLKICGNCVLSNSISTIFPTAFAHSTSLCHVLVILPIFQTFSLLLYVFWWSVISDLWCYCCNINIVLEHYNLTHVRLWTLWINVVCVLTALPTSHSLISPPS